MKLFVDLAPILLAAIGLFAEHVWAHRRIKKIEVANSFEAKVETPVGALRQRLSDLAVDVLEWRYGRGNRQFDDLSYSWTRLSRDINRKLNDLEEQKTFGPSGTWINVLTDAVDAAFGDANPELKDLASTSIAGPISALDRDLRDALYAARPK